MWENESLLSPWLLVFFSDFLQPLLSPSKQRSQVVRLSCGNFKYKNPKGKPFILWGIPPTELKTDLNGYLHTHTLYLQQPKVGSNSSIYPTAVLLPGKSHGQRRLVGCSPWGCEESDTTERLPFHFSLSCIGEGNGNPLQGSCLENPRDGGAWWAVIYGVAQSRT